LDGVVSERALSARFSVAANVQDSPEGEVPMKSHLVSALALSLAFAPIAAAPAFAGEAAQFRSAAPQSFSADELQRYGLTADETAQVRAYQAQGYNVVVMTPEQAQQYVAGESSDEHHHFHLLVLVGLVVLIAVAVD
jgi:hypothetical protein